MDNQQILVLLKQANELIHDEKCDEALEVLTQIDAEGEKEGFVSFLKGNAYLQMEQDQQAHLCYAEALNKGFISKELYINFGVVKGRLGNLLQAEMMFRQAADIDPTDALPLNRILLLRLMRRDFDGAEAVMDELMQRNPELVDGYHHKADMFLGTGRVQEALELLLGVVERFSSHPLYLYDLCRALRRNGKTDEALELLEKHKDVFRSDEEQQLYNKQKAQLLVELTRYEEAVPLWKELYDLFGDRQSGLALTADALSRNDMESLYRIADEMSATETYDDAHYMCLYYKGLALQQLGDEAAAREAYARALQQFNEMETGRMSLQLRSLRATIRMELGHYDEALADLDDLIVIARESGSDPEKINRSVKELEELKEIIKKRMSSFT